MWQKQHKQKSQNNIQKQTKNKQYLASLPEGERAAAEGEMKRWQSAMTYKFAGALDDFVGRPEPVVNIDRPRDGQTQRFWRFVPVKP